MITLGKDRNHDEIRVDTDESHVILIGGKRGSGKSYTLGVIAEELCLEEKFVPIIFDPLGIFWTMCMENDQPEVHDWDLVPEPIPVRLFVPGDPMQVYGDDVLDEMEFIGIDVTPLRIPVSEIEPDEWLDLFNFSLVDPMGIALFRATSKLYGSEFTLDDIVEEVTSDDYAHDKTKVSLISRLEVAKQWKIFGDEPWKIFNMFQAGAANVIDLSGLDPHRYGLRQFIAMVVAKKLFSERIRARRVEEVGFTSDVPRIWLLIDEGHQFIPAGRNTSSKPILMRWVKEGRQPGLSIVMTTQQPSALDSEVLSQCDVTISHKITMKTDLNALNAINQEYMRFELREYVKRIKNPGEAIYLDDNSEKVRDIYMRARVSRHGGREI